MPWPQSSKPSVAIVPGATYALSLSGHYYTTSSNIYTHVRLDSIHTNFYCRHYKRPHVMLSVARSILAARCLVQTLFGCQLHDAGKHYVTVTHIEPAAQSYHFVKVPRRRVNPFLHEQVLDPRILLPKHILLPRAHPTSS